MSDAACPTCGRQLATPASGEPSAAELPEHFPFCSQRCRLIDLGRWADGAYVIPGAPVDPESLSAPPRP